jgi:uncharacterized membrane protein
MWILILGLVLFIGIHLVPALPRKRHKLFRRLGETTYKIVFTAVSLVGLALIIWGYASVSDQDPILFDMPHGLLHLTMLLVLIAFILFASSFFQGYIKYWVRHPQITAVKVWALAHLLVKGGDVAAILLFGSLLAWAVFDRISLKKREQIGLVKTRNFTPKILNDVIAVVLGVAVYLAFMFYLHKFLIGVPIV